MTKARIERLLRATIATYFQKYNPIPFPGILPCITKVEVAPSLDLASIHMSFVGREEIDRPKLLRELLSTHHWQIKRYVSKALRHDLRRIPSELRFYLDEHGKQASKVSRLLDTIPEA